MEAVTEKTWLSGEEAAALMTALHGRTISAAYIRRLAGMGYVKSQAPGRHFCQYYGPDLKSYRIRRRTDPRKQQQTG